MTKKNVLQLADASKGRPAAGGDAADSESVSAVWTGASALFAEKIAKARADSCGCRRTLIGSGQRDVLLVRA